MSIEMRMLHNECPRCRGTGLARVTRGPAVACSCPAGRVTAVSMAPLQLVLAVNSLRTSRAQR